MRTNRMIAVPALALSVLFATSACATSSGSADTSAPASVDAADDSLYGVWSMTSLEQGVDGESPETVPYSGQISFTESGNVAVQAMNPDTEAPDTAYTVNGYEAYYGDLDVDEDAGTFTMEVESALARDLIGQSLERAFEVSGDTLVLTPADPSEGWRVTYDRISD